MKELNATLTRPLCYSCNSTDVLCGECGFDFEECSCDPMEREAYGTDGFTCKICFGPATDQAEWLNGVKADCPACGEQLTSENIATWPKFAANSLCDECYVDSSLDLIGKGNTDNGELIVLQNDGPCIHDRFHLCDDCGIYRVSTKDKWTVIENIDLEFKIECTCKPEKQFACQECNVFRKSTSDPWGRGDLKKNLATGSKPTVTTTGKTYVSSGTGNTTYYGKCRHYGQALTFPDGTTVYASSSNSKRDVKDMPDFGLYLDWVWKPTWRAEFIDWADYGTPSNFDAAYEAIVEAWERAKTGKKVEVGCIGGHGRTGTALACMGVLSGQTAADAIKYVRDKYCTETLETSGQEWFVRWFHAEWNELPFEEKEPQSWYGGGYGDYGYSDYGYSTGGSSVTKASDVNGNYNGSHTTGQHFKMWVTGTQCTSEKCTWGKRDFESFAKGMQITQNTLDMCDVHMNGWTAQAYRIVTDLNKKRPTTLKLNFLDKLTPVMIKVNGYMVPKPMPTDIQHNPVIKNCACDPCRYFAMGGRALFDTAPETSLVHKDDTDGLVIKMMVGGGEVIDVAIAESFNPKPPAAATAKNGKRKGEYIYLEEHGWVWDQLKLAEKNNK